MGKNSSIGWTDHTFNPWWGCFKKSPGCANCYAESFAKRAGYSIWGPNTTRRVFAENHWNEPLKWNRLAKDKPEPTLVFCGSMCDIFEDHPLIEQPRRKLWKLIADTPALTWLLLTKNSENIERMVPEAWLADAFPHNVWLGVSVESQAYIHRIAEIAYLTVWRFVSIEPMLGPVDFTEWFWAVNWVICGGESGPNAREMDLQWANDLLELCRWKHIPFFMKQLGTRSHSYWTSKDSKGENIAYFPKELQVREFPDF